MAKILDKKIKVTLWESLEVEIRSHSAALEPRHRLDESQRQPMDVEGVITMEWSAEERAAYMENREGIDAIHDLLDEAVKDEEPELRVTAWNFNDYGNCVSFRPKRWERR